MRSKQTELILGLDKTPLTIADGHHARPGVAVASEGRDAVVAEQLILAAARAGVRASFNGDVAMLDDEARRYVAEGSKFRDVARYPSGLSRALRDCAAQTHADSPELLVITDAKKVFGENASTWARVVGEAEAGGLVVFAVVETLEVVQFGWLEPLRTRFLDGTCVHFGAHGTAAAVGGGLLKVPYADLSGLDDYDGRIFVDRKPGGLWKLP
jgi:hypothetical protein